MTDWLRFFVPAAGANVSEMCGIFARKLNPHRVFIPVPDFLLFYCKLPECAAHGAFYLQKIILSVGRRFPAL
jgi:hypothetical protein